MYIGTIEAGGTKFVLGILDEEMKIIAREEIPTKTPAVTYVKCLEFFKRYSIDALGIGFFGPIDVNKKSKTYGSVLNTPKPNWANVDVVNFFKTNLNVPVGFDTDVNAASLAELTYGAGKGYSDIVYITVGTGIGAGVIVDNKLVHGNLHPEVGHTMLARKENDDFISVCKYHPNCAEGLACGPAVEKRTGLKGKDINNDHKVWDTTAYYLGQLVANLVLTTSPQKIVMGGGLMHKEVLFPLINNYAKEFINNYVEVKDDLVVPTTLDDNAGIFGAFQLGIDALKS